MDKNISKKLFAGVCALSAAFILAACDPISAVPAHYDDPIVTKTDGSNITDDDNMTGKIYDAIATDRNTKIVSDLLEEVALGRYGSYKEICDSNANRDEKIKYVKKYAKVFQRKDDEKLKDIDINDLYEARFDNFYSDVMARINEFFYNEITSGSYNDDEGRFDEVKYFLAHFYEFYDISYPKESDGSYKSHKFFVTNEVTKETKFVGEGADPLFGLIGSYSNPGKRGYIEEKVFPQILKDKLVEEYVLNNNYASLGRAYARKVNYIKVSYEKDDVMAWDMMQKFADDYINKVNADTELNCNFEIVVRAMKGFNKVGTFEGSTGGVQTLDTAAGEDKVAKAANDLLAAVLPSGEKIKITGGSHYKIGGDVLIPDNSEFYLDTKIGQLVDSYEKAIRAEESGRFPIASEKAELDKFTSSGKSKAYGLREKLISLAKEDYTTDGWFVKNGGLSELPSALRDRLFNINVANTLDDGSLKYEANIETEEVVDDVKHYPLGAYETDTDGKAVKRMPYMRNIYGNKFVIPAKSLAYKDNHYNYIYNDKTGHAYYIVLVEEAPSTAKLTLTSDKSYSKLPETKDDVFKTEEVSRAVAKVLGTKDSYIKDAYTEILKNYEFVFYETSLYEHFKSEYPDLFEDED